MVILVTGASGQLGQALQFVAGDYPEIQFHFAASAQADITNMQSLADIFEEVNPDYCINAAAYTAVDKAESETEKAYAINVTGAANLAKACKENNCKLIHISTDFVFDGQQDTPYKESDPVSPQGVYGLTKLQGEQAIAAVFDQYFIVRTAWVYSRFGNNFMKTMLRVASERPELGVVNDQIGTPTLANDLARAVIAMAQANSTAYGIYHFSNEGAISWYDFAQAIFEIHGVKVKLNAIPTSAYPTPAKRPAYSVLDKTKIKESFQLAVRPWREALENA